MNFIEQIKFDAQGLVPAIAQDAATKDVLMLAYMNKEAIEKTLETGIVHYYSRSRGALWQKGETSGHIQHLVDLRYDCDGDTILAIVNQEGVACHTGNWSCFYRNAAGAVTEGRAAGRAAETLYQVFETIKQRQENPKEGSYTNYLFDKGTDKILKKVGEEAAEVIIATKNRDADEIRYETADLIYHLSVNLAENNMTWDDIFTELEKRQEKK